MIHILCHLGFSQIHSKTHLTPLWLWLKLIQSDSSLIHSDLTWWWQPSWILPSWIQPSAILDSDSLTLLFSSDSLKNTHSLTLTLTLTNSSLINCHSLDSDTAILNSATLNCAILNSAILHKNSTLTSDSNSFNLTQLDDGSHLEFCHLGFRHCHLGFRHLVIFSQIHSKTLSLHSDSNSN